MKNTVHFSFISLIKKSLFILFQDELVHNVHENAVISIETSKDCKLIATSSDYGHPSAAVWKVVDTPVEEILSLDVW